MPIVNGVEADHHVFVVPEIVDGDVVRSQAEQKYLKRDETSYIHQHKSQDECEGHKHAYVGPS